MQRPTMDSMEFFEVDGECHSSPQAVCDSTRSIVENDSGIGAVVTTGKSISNEKSLECASAITIIDDDDDEIANSRKMPEPAGGPTTLLQIDSSEKTINCKIDNGKIKTLSDNELRMEQMSASGSDATDATEASSSNRDLKVNTKLSHSKLESTKKTPPILQVKIVKDNKIVVVPVVEPSTSEGSPDSVYPSKTRRLDISQTYDSQHLRPIDSGGLESIADSKAVASSTPISSKQQQQGDKLLGVQSRNSPISREFLALQRSVNDSKVLSEMVTEASAKKAGRRMRSKSTSAGLKRMDGDSAEQQQQDQEQESLMDSVAFLDRNSFDDAPNSSLGIDPLDTRAQKRGNLRSQNTEFAQKHMDFLSRVRNYDEGDDNSEADDADERASASTGDGDAAVLARSEKSANSDSLSSEYAFVEARIRAKWHPPPKRGWDSFCWKCCESSNVFPCSKCVRVFHSHCIRGNASTKIDSNWICPECVAIEQALTNQKRLNRPQLSADMLNQLLAFALRRMQNAKDNFKYTLGDEELSKYSKYIVSPVTFKTLQEKVDSKAFQTPEEFVSECRWMHHNALILSSAASKSAILSKSIARVARQESTEIETCPECYLNANTREDWFIDVCSQPHLLVWAKLKGFPYWPGKAMGSGPGTVVRVRFFGDHDHAQVPVKDVFLYSEKAPIAQTSRRQAGSLAECVREAAQHIENIKTKVGSFRFAPFKTPYNPLDEIGQLRQMMPGVEEYMKRQQELFSKPPLQYKFVKISDNGNGAASKYEVVRNTKTDDGGSTSKVILKRKSDGQIILSDSSTLMTDVKIAKISISDGNGHSSGSTSGSNGHSHHHHHGKRKHRSSGSGSEQSPSKEPLDQRNKYARQELRVPVLTIKTNTAKISDAGDNDSAFASKTLPQLTIKKLKATEGEKANESASSSIETGTSKSPGDGNAVAEPTEESNKKSNEVQMKELRPLTEIKTEPPDEEKQSEQQKINESFPTETTDIARNSEAKPSSGANAKSSATAEKQPASQKPNPSAQASEVPRPVPELLTEIKKEIPSDDEGAECQPEPAEQSSGVSSSSGVLFNQVKVSTFLPDAGHVRILGDTTIQRLSTRASAAGNASLSGCGTTASNHNSSSSPGVGKRGPSRGVPYGPLPASASINMTVSQMPLNPKSPAAASATPENGNKQLITAFSGSMPSEESSVPSRARKAFPGANVATTTMISKLTRQSKQQSAAANNATATLPSTITVTYSDPKRNVLKTTASMVAIPFDVANTRNATTVIPMPPLTAVSKTNLIASSTGHSDNAQNTGSTIASNSTLNVSSSVDASPPCIGSITPAAFSNINANSSTSTANATVMQARQAPAIATAQASLVPPSNAFPMSTMPPPLVNLSQSTVSSNSGQILAGHLSNLNSLPMVSSSLPMVSFSLSSSTESPAAINHNSTNILLTPISQSPPDLGSNSTPSSAAVGPQILNDGLTPNLASVINEVICRGPPKMLPRPTRPLQSDGSRLFPSQAGPACAKLAENAHKFTDYFITVMEDTLREMAEGEPPVLQAKIQLLTMEMERIKQSYEQQISELKRNSELMITEIRKSVENEKMRFAAEVRKQCELERLRSVEEAKKKQWCAQCGREAQFYCCWNTSYCDYPCQQQHWVRHATTCTQPRIKVSSKETTGANSNTLPANVSEPSISKNSMKATTLTADTQASYKKSQQQTQKKEKHSSPASNRGHNKNTPVNIQLATPSSNDILKLPSNTFLRPLPGGASNSSSTGNINGANMGNTSRNILPTSNNFSIIYNRPASPAQRLTLANQPMAQNPMPQYALPQRPISGWDMMPAANKNQMQAQTALNMMQPALPLITSVTSVHPQQQQQPMHQQKSPKSRSQRHTNSNVMNNAAAMNYNGNLRSGNNM